MPWHTVTVSARRKNDYKIERLVDQHIELHVSCPGTVSQWQEKEQLLEDRETI